MQVWNIFRREIISLPRLFSSTSLIENAASPLIFYQRSIKWPAFQLFKSSAFFVVSPRHMLTIDLLFCLFPSISCDCLNLFDFIWLLSLCKFFMAHGRFTAASAAWAHRAYLNAMTCLSASYQDLSMKIPNEQKKDSKKGFLKKDLSIQDALHSLHFE